MTIVYVRSIVSMFEKLETAGAGSRNGWRGIWDLIHQIDLQDILRKPGSSENCNLLCISDGECLHGSFDSTNFSTALIPSSAPLPFMLLGNIINP